MGLQVRLRHALGERLFDLPDRPIANPLVIGRARDADIKIPSVTVSGQHGAMFVHEGQWYVQDTSGARATWVNGNALEGPTPLCVGDTITLGADANPVTIEVDPAGVAEGRMGEPVASYEPAPVASRHGTITGVASSQPIWSSSTPSLRSSAGHQATPPPPPPTHSAASADDPWGNAPAGDDPFAGWSQPGTSALTGGVRDTPNIRRKKPARQMSQGALFVGVGVCVAIVGGTLWTVYAEMHPVPVVVIEEKTPTPVMVYGESGSSVFSEHQKGERVVVPPVGSNTATVSTPSPAAAAPADSTDSNSSSAADSTPDSNAKSDPAWDALDAVLNAPVGQRIQRYDDYRRQHAGAHTLELDNLINDAMDTLWWKRTAELCVRREDLTRQVAQKDKDIREQPAGAFQETLKSERKPLDTQLVQVQKTLTTDMAYTSETALKVDDKEMISKLSSERDVGKFNEWKSRTIKFILIHHGSLPWE